VIRGSRVSEPKRYETTRYEDGEPREHRDSVPAESSVDIFLCGTRIVTLQATPDEQVELAVGFLLSEGLLQDSSEYVGSTFDSEEGVVHIEARDRSAVLSRLLDKGEVMRTSGCGRGTSFGGYGDIPKVNTHLEISPAIITQLTGLMLEGARLHSTCGGVHCSALARDGEILFLSEDIGRHNTMDKIIGKGTLSGTELSSCIALTTGRVSSEMVAKCARLCIPVIASLSCPTDMAVEIGKRLGVTIVGYVRGRRLTVYTHEDRVRG